MPLPAVPDTFRWTRESWGDALRCRPLEDIASHLFTTRQLELRGDAQAPGWQQVTRDLNVRRDALVRVRQVHGRGVLVVKGPSPTPLDPPPEADAIVSDHPDVAVAVRVADCVPLLIADPRTGAVGAVHAGWRGTAAGVAVAAVEALQREFGARPGDMVAAVGPSIGVCCYTVGSELVDAFAAAGHGRSLIHRWFVSPPRHSELRLDLWTANRDQLVLAGVKEEHIHHCGLCTASHPDVFYSFRAEGEKTGRLAAAIRARASTNDGDRPPL